MRLRTLFPLKHNSVKKPNFYSSSSQKTTTNGSSVIRALKNKPSSSSPYFSMHQLYQIQAHLTTSGHFNDTVLPTRVLTQFANLGNVDHTLLIFRHFTSLDAFHVNAVIKAYSVSSTCGKQAVDFYFDCLKDGFFPNSYTFVWLLSVCGKLGCVGIARKCHGQVVKHGADNVLYVQNSLVYMYGCCRSCEFMSQVFFEMGTRDLVSWNSVVHGYGLSRDMGVAHRVFDVMPVRNVVSWNVMISGYLKDGSPGCALMMFRRMVRKGLRGSLTSMVSVVTACGRSGRLKEGRSVHGFLFRCFVKSSVVVATALIDMYSKCGRAEVAQRIFDMMSYRNLVCWNAMIVGHCVHGDADEGLRLFAEMERRTKDGKNSRLKSLECDADCEPVRPDAVTFIGVLCACARAGLLTEGKIFISRMIDEFRIKPNFGHLWCMANLLVGKGLIQEAEQLLRSLPEDEEDVTPESSMWANLFTSCRFQGDVTLGERIATSLIEMDPNNFLGYRLLMNIYAVAGRWEDVARVKNMIKEGKIKRIPGCSLQDLKEIVHSFQVRDNWQQEEVADKMIGEIAGS